mgnify:CR=1 FL=1
MNGLVLVRYGIDYRSLSVSVHAGPVAADVVLEVGALVVPDEASELDDAEPAMAKRIARSHASLSSRFFAYSMNTRPVCTRI